MPAFERVSKELGVIALTGNNTLLANTGAIIDTLGYESLTWHFAAGAISAGAITITFKESDDSGMSGATTVPAVSLIAADGSTAASLSVTMAMSTGAYEVGDTGKLRYHQVATVVNGGTGPVSCIAVQGHPRKMPTS